MYTYLGIDLEKQGWASIIKTNCTGARISENRLASVARVPEAGLKVGHLARLHDTYSRPRLMYGAEIWSITSVARLKELERTQNAAGRHIFGRGGEASVIKEAIRGDLGWLTMESRVALAKFRFYGRLCRLSDTRLVKLFFSIARARWESFYRRTTSSLR
jgi:hypothetical protein